MKTLRRSNSLSRTVFSMAGPFELHSQFKNFSSVSVSIIFKVDSERLKGNVIDGVHPKLRITRPN